MEEEIAKVIREFSLNNSDKLLDAYSNKYELDLSIDLARAICSQLTFRKSVREIEAIDMTGCKIENLGKLEFFEDGHIIANDEIPVSKLNYITT